MRKRTLADKVPHAKELRVKLPGRLAEYIQQEAVKFRRSFPAQALMMLEDYASAQHTPKEIQ